MNKFKPIENIEELQNFSKELNAKLIPRDPKRINLVLRLLKKYWTQHSDLRLGQLIGNLAGKDFYFFEDDKLVERLTEELKTP